jgi:SAM-dependent methyltransferase
MKKENPDASQSPLVEARAEAQKLVHGPLLFQAARLLRDFGILKALRNARAGQTLEELAAKVSASSYGILVLLEAGLAAGMVRKEEGEKYLLTDVGAVIMADEMTRTNMDFVQHFCYQAMYYLEDSIREGKPVGLQKIFGDWPTVYPAVPTLPDPARSSWYRWDHYYSDAAFPAALPLVFERPHGKLLDVGGNTGKWALQCVAHSPGVAVTILDLPALEPLARKNVTEHAQGGRIAFQPMNLLDHSQPFPPGHDAIWMSQFLVCFPESDVQKLLERAAAALAEGGRLYILDTFWDRQAYQSATYSLQASSLYFTCLANGVSRMYKASDIVALVEAAGMKVEHITDNLGVCSSLMVCRRR